MRFRRALHGGKATEALLAAGELQFVGLGEALELTLLLAEGEDARYERAALRWHARFVYETKNVDIRESVAVRALLTSIPANRRAASALAELFGRPRSLERSAEALVRWCGWRRTSNLVVPTLLAERLRRPLAWSRGNGWWRVRCECEWRRDFNTRSQAEQAADQHANKFRRIEGQHEVIVYPCTLLARFVDWERDQSE
jgi:hypothetical protein